MMDLDGDPWATEGVEGHDVGAPQGSSRGSRSHATGDEAHFSIPSFLPLPSTNFIIHPDPNTSTSNTSEGTAPDVAPNGALPDNDMLTDYVRRPFRAATAPAARRFYVITSLIVGWSLALLFIAALAYPVFYYTYVPKQIVTVPVHLQYNAALNPYGLTYFSKDLMLETSYDVIVELTLPRSPANLDRGNFMVALFATTHAPNDPAHSWNKPGDPYKLVSADSVIFSSRRPALIPFTDPVVSLASRLLFIIYHIFVPTSDRVTLNIPMGELVEFRDQLPLSVLLDVQAGQTLQVYSARIELVARLRGIRWLMYNYRFLSFVLCTTLFWIAEMVSMAIAWLLLGYCLSFRRRPRRVAAAPMNQNPAGPGPGAGAIVGGKAVEGAISGGGQAGSGSGSGSKAAGNYTHSGGIPSVGVKSEDLDDVKIKEESVDGSTLVETPRREGDPDDEELGQTTARFHEEKEALRKRLSPELGDFGME